MYLSEIYFFKGLEKYRLNHKYIYRILQIGIYILFFFFFWLLVPLLLELYFGVLLYRHQIIRKIKRKIAFYCRLDLNYDSTFAKIKRILFRILYTVIILIVLFIIVALVLPLFVVIPICIGYNMEKNKNRVKTKTVEKPKEFFKKEKDENILNRVRLT